MQSSESNPPNPYASPAPEGVGHNAAPDKAAPESLALRIVATFAGITSMAAVVVFACLAVILAQGSHLIGAAAAVILVIFNIAGVVLVIQRRGLLALFLLIISMGLFVIAAMLDQGLMRNG